MSKAGFVGQRLVLRSAVLLFLGVVLVGVLLDLLLQRLDQGGEYYHDRQWLAANFELLSKRLEGTTEEHWPNGLHSFQQEFGLVADALPLGDMAMPDSVVSSLQAGDTVQLFDVADTPVYYRLLSAEQQLEGSPIVLSLRNPNAMPPAQNDWRWINYLYYAAVFLLLAWWLFPLVRDIQLLNAVATRLGKDINAEPGELSRVTELRVLADTIQTMAQRIRAMVQGQKDMTNALSHELRTPLARVKFALAVLDQRVDDEARQELHNISSDINEFDELVARMLDYARLDDPSLQFQAQAIAVTPWLSELCDKLRAEERGIQCSLRVDPAAEELHADPSLLTLAVSNLVNNALRYSSGTIELSAQFQQGEWVLHVDDDGPGIPEDQLESVFKPFTRLDKSRDRGTGGHGLGLAVVARIAERHAGRCMAAHSPLSGARFSIHIPRA